MDLPVGTLVAPSPEFRAAMNTGDGAAVLLSRRRGSAHLYYTSSDREYWVPTRDVRPLPPEAVPDTCLESLLSDLLLFVRAEDSVLEERADDTMHLTIETPALARDALRTLEARLGARLVDFALEAGSMRAMVLRVWLASLPPSLGEGR